jgi:hypothetical protein
MDKCSRFTVIVVLILAAGCGNTVEQRLQAIDGMQGVLTNVMLNAEELEPTQVAYLQQDIETKSSQLVEDSLTAKDRTLILEFKQLGGRLQQSMDARAKLVTEVKRTRLKLADLSSDVRNNHWPQDSLNLYLDIEFQYVMELDEKMESMIAQVNGCFQTYDQINPRIDSLLTDIKIQ